MNPLSNFAHSLREYNIHEAIRRFPTPFWLIYFFLIPIESTLVHKFVQRGTYSDVYWVLMLNNLQLQST